MIRLKTQMKLSYENLGGRGSGGGENVPTRRGNRADNVLLVCELAL